MLPQGVLEQRDAVFTTTCVLFLTRLTLFLLTLLASSLTRTSKVAVLIGAVILLLFYGISITAEYLEVPMLYCLTPLKFFDVYTVAMSGIQFSFLLLAMIIAIGSVITAQRVWMLREI